jgi:hypothetical protein
MVSVMGTEEPTNAQNRTLTRAEKAVLDILADPAYFKATNEEKVEASGVSRRRFYEILADPWVRDQQKQLCLDMIRSRVNDIVGAAVTSAVECIGKEGHLDRKMLLEMSGLYEPKQKQEHTGTMAITFAGESDLKDEGE